MARPYLQSGIVELEVLYEASRAKRLVLTDLRAELTWRKTERSERLRGKVEWAIAAIDAATGQGGLDYPDTATVPAGNTRENHVQVELPLESPQSVGFAQGPGNVGTGTTEGTAPPQVLPLIPESLLGKACEGDHSDSVSSHVRTHETRGEPDRDPRAGPRRFLLPRIATRRSRPCPGGRLPEPSR